MSGTLAPGGLHALHHYGCLEFLVDRCVLNSFGRADSRSAERMGAKLAGDLVSRA